MQSNEFAYQDNLSVKSFQKLAPILFSGLFLAAINTLGGPLLVSPDSDSYMTAANKIIEGTFSLTSLPSHRTAGYPAFLATIQHIAPDNMILGIKLAQGILISITHFLVAAITLLLTRNVRLAIIAGIFSLLNIALFYSQNQVLTEPLYITTLYAFIFASLMGIQYKSILWTASAFCLCAGLMWIRPMAKLLIFAPVLLYVGHSFVALSHQKYRPQAIRLFGGLIIGMLVFTISATPLFLGNEKQKDSSALGLSMWVRVFDYCKLTPADDPEFESLISEYDLWRAKHPTVYSEYGWRYNGVIQEMLRDQRGMTKTEAHAWMLRRVIKTIQENIIQYTLQYIVDASKLMVFYADSPETRAQFSFTNDPDVVTASFADSYHDKLFGSQTQFNNYHLAETYPLYGQKVSALFAHFYIFIGKFSSLAVSILFALLAGIGFYAGFKKIHLPSYLFILAIGAYNFAIPLLFFGPGLKYRLPADGVFAILQAMGAIYIITFTSSIIGPKGRQTEQN